MARRRGKIEIEIKGFLEEAGFHTAIGADGDVQIEESDAGGKRVDRPREFSIRHGVLELRKRRVVVSGSIRW